MEAQYRKFLDMIRAVRINVPLIYVLPGMLNFALIQNKVPPKLGDPGSFLIPYTFSKTFSCNALANLGASINLMPYSLYAKLSLETLKPTKMSIRLADRSFQFPIGIAENMLVKVGKFTFLVDFIILEMEEDISVKVFMDDFSVFGNSFDNCLNNLDKMLQCCEDVDLVLNWKKCHFMVKEGMVLGHKVSGASLEVDEAKIDVISKLPPPTNVKGIRSFLGHASFYRCFIKNFSKFARPLTKLLEKDTPFEFNDECHKAFNSEFAVGAVLGQKDGKHFHPIYFASKTLNVAQQNYTELDIEIKDKKGVENVVAHHLSRTENNETSEVSEVKDNFPRETLMEIITKDEPWFADFANYLLGDVIPKGMTYQQKNKFFSDLKNYFWEDPYLFKVCSDGMIRCCVLGSETHTILDQCHHGPIVGHYGPTTTAKKVLDSSFYWPSIIKEAHTLVRLCKAC
ncbi:reverse transcriptase domain-containing protein [Tanacetum coccineum]|uniref:Reverse transcriptase domain-containing protein n=1 Tax=Tanacetum coccineum TaxID=301880 RepID=A0ABQ4ZSX7_9ASTR